jgi:hypothetical protein
MACGNARAAMDVRRRKKTMSPCTRAFGLLAAAFALAGCDVRFDSTEGVQQRLGSSHVAAGGALNLVDPVAGDAFLAGGRVAVATEVQGDLVLAGGDISVGGAVGDDLYGAGGEVQLDAIVSGNARLAGGDVTVGPATVVRGDVKLSGGRLRFEGSTDGGLQATGAQVTIDGVVQGDAEVRAESVEIGPQARVAGRLIVRAAQPPTVADGAVIAGGVEFEQGDFGEFVTVEGEPTAVEQSHGVGSFLWILGVFVAGTLFTLAFPAYSGRAADWIGREPLRSLALGFVILVCLPILAVLLLVTIVGIPLALILLMLYVLLLFLGWVTAALFLSRKGLQWFRRGQQPAGTAARLGALLAAVLALWLAGRIPFIGGWVSFLSLLLGIGALVWQGWPRRTPPASPALTAGAA